MSDAAMLDARHAAMLDARLAAALPPGALFAVGGRVRDELRTALDGIPRPAKDLDYVVVGLDLDALLDRLRTLGRADVVGAAFAVVKLTLEGTVVDVALPRRERSSGVGHREFVVEAGPDIPLESDLARRDFRMNMIARAIPSGELVDPYAGAADVGARRIDIIADGVFAEDPLRMLRACQFAARFAFEPTARTLAAMRAAAPLVASVSAERVRDELSKLLEQAERPSIGIELMRTTGLLAYVLPEVAEGIDVEQNAYHAYDVYRHALATVDATPAGDRVLRIAALLHDVGKPRTRDVTPDGTHFYGHENVGETMARDVLERLRFPSDETQLVARLVKHHMYAADPALGDATIRRFIRRIGVDALDRQFALRAADVRGSGLPARGDGNERFEARVRALLAERPPLTVRDLAIDGSDVLELLGIGPNGRGDRRVGEILSFVLERVMEDATANRAIQLEIAAARAREISQST